jgi:aminopeptidase YwaD
MAEERLSYNIIARWPGNTPTKAIICAHYDSVREGPGANDNASGVAAVLEAARTMAGIPGVTFIAFGAEEPGLFGSQYYVNRMSALAVDDLWAVVNLDMVGWPGGTLKMEKYGWQSQRFQSRALATAASLGIIAEGGLSTGGSDHVPFANRGIAELHFWTGMDPDHHGPGDTEDKVDATTIANAGRIAVALAWQLVNDLPPPAAP